MADRELGPDVSGPKELPLDEGGLGYVTFTVSRELGPDVSSDEGILSGCPLCGSRMLQAPSGEPTTPWCPDDGYVPAERLRTLRRFDYSVGWSGRRAMSWEQGTRAGGF